MKTQNANLRLTHIFQILLICFLTVISVLGVFNGATAALDQEEFDPGHRSPTISHLTSVKPLTNSGGQWLRTFNLNDSEEFNVVRETTDGGFIVAGSTYVSPDNKDIWLAKLDADGTILWEKTYGGPVDDFVSEINQTADSGFIVAANTSASGNYDAWILKLNGDGAINWQKTFGGDTDVISHDIQETSNGSIVVIGTTAWPDGPFPTYNDASDAWVIKLHTDGTIDWQKQFDNSNVDQVFSIQETSDNGFIVGGQTFSDAPSPNNIFRGWALKLTNNGTISWEKTYEIDRSGGFSSIQETSDGGFVATGGYSLISGEHFEMIVKLQSNGAVSWQQSFSWNNTIHIAEIQETPTGEFIIAGYIGYQDDSGGPLDAWIAKLATNGSIVWQKTYDANYDDRAESVQITSDGGYIVAGTTGDTSGSVDPWVMKIDSSGNIPGCSVLGIGTVSVTSVPVTVQDTNASVQNATHVETNTTVSPVAVSTTNQAVCQTESYYSISGQLKDHNDNPVPDIAIATNSGQSAVTNAAGYYTITLLTTDSYVIAPKPTNVTFQPVSRTVTITSTNIISQNFVMVTPTLDLIPYGVEVTQGVQDLHNSVTLIEGKRTFVRFYVRANEPGTYSTTAQLRVAKDGNITILDPINKDNGYVGVQMSPDRSNLEDVFLFELPTHLTSGSVAFEPEVNPAGNGRNPVEVDYANNIISPFVLTFEPVDPVNIVFYRMGYRYWDDGIQTQPPPASDAELLETVDLMKSMFPINQVVIHPIRSGTVYDFLIPLRINCFTVNFSLMNVKNFDFYGNMIPAGTRYYAISDDVNNQFFDGGCAWPIFNPSFGGVGSAETNTNKKAWLHVHEFGHTFGREHTPNCNEFPPINYSYPYPNARISPTDVLDSPNAIFGLDMDTMTIYSPDQKDIMSYCNDQWISDYTYESIKWYNDIFPSVSFESKATTDRLTVMGLIDPDTGEVTLHPMFVAPDAEDIEPRTPGDYDIVLKDSQGGELVRYPFTPDEVHDYSGEEMLVISEWVPFVPGTTQVDIEGPTSLLTTVSAGASAPTVTIISPNGGEIISSDTITLTWSASDIDKDPLSYMVQYSTDNGTSWKLAAAGLTDTNLVLDAGNIPGSTEALFRVWASDGIHTTIDASDAIFTVVNHEPTVTIISPSEPITIAVNQTLGLEGDAYDNDIGMMDGTSLEWSSSLNGVLGYGRQLSVVGLNVGIHSITLTADDGAGAIVTDTVEVTVVEDIDALPPIPDMLVVNPQRVNFVPHLGYTASDISVENQTLARSIDWNAVNNIPWVQLSATSGMTPDDIQMTYMDVGLGEGLHTGTITYTSSISPNTEIIVEVSAEIDQTVVRFTDNVVATTTAWDITEITANVPPGTTGGPVTIQTDTGLSNGTLFKVGSSFIPDVTGQSSEVSDKFSGVITTDTTWDENLLITGDVTIPSGVTLTIDPGVTILFAANSDDKRSGSWPDKVEIHIYGTLIAEGTEEAPIYFASEDTTPMPGDWGALVIHKNSTASSLSHCMIRHAKNGVRFLANKVGGGTIGGTVSNCSLTENEMGVYMYGNPGYPAGGTIVLNPTIRNNLIHENYEYGIYIQASTGYGTSRNEALIENNVITFNAGGIFLKGNSWWLGHADIFTVIKNNTIRESLAGGIYIEAEGSSDNSGSDTDVQPVVENNLLENNGIGNIRLLLDPLGNDGIQILQPVIRYNTIRNAANGIWIQDTGNQDTLNPIIAFNVFYDLGSYAINNLTNRAISAQSNYWGDSETAWDAGPQPGDTYGSVNTSNYLTTTAAPVLTRIVPAAAQPGEEIILFGANFGLMIP